MEPFPTFLVVALLIAAVICAILSLRKGTGGSCCGDCAECRKNPQDCKK